MAIVHTDPVVDERHVVHHDTDSSSSANMIVMVLLIAMLVIGFLLFATRAFPFNATGNTRSNLDVNLPDVNVPVTNPPDVNVNQDNSNNPPVNY
jgi:hypothetical protein